jgi:UDPglucose--hexose-1-phosphate uridylyltransferase
MRVHFNHYFIGSNADLPIVGGSILSHDHFQGGCYHFAMEDAEMRHRFIISPYLDVTCYILYWPLSVIRLQSKSKQQLIKLSAHILNTWIDYRDEELNIIPYTDGIRHHTITPIARKKGDLYEMDLVLRSNITNSEHPLGIFHPHEEHHHLKKENIGLIEVMGLAVLPGRLVSELRMIKEALKENIPFASQISYHEAWIKQIMERRMLTKSMFYEDFDNIIKEEIGYKFACILEDAGVFKTDQIGYEHFIKFTKNL